MYVTFQLQLSKLTETTDKTATRGALRAAFKVTESDLDRWVADARQYDQWSIEIWATPAQFSTFLILRDEYGAQNLFAQLRARITDMDAPLAFKRVVDCVRPNDDGPYTLRDRHPKRFVSETNMRKADRVERHAKFNERMSLLRERQRTELLERRKVQIKSLEETVASLRDRLVEGAKLMGLILDASGLARQSPLARRGAEYITENENSETENSETAKKEAAIRWSWSRNK